MSKSKTLATKALILSNYNTWRGNADISSFPFCKVSSFCRTRADLIRANILNIIILFNEPVNIYRGSLQKMRLMVSSLCSIASPTSLKSARALHKKQKLFQTDYSEAERSLFLLDLLARATGSFQTAAEIQKAIELPVHTSASLGLCGRKHECVNTHQLDFQVSAA